MRRHFSALKLTKMFFLAIALLQICFGCNADGHYHPGVIGVRDGTVTPKGVYLFAYAPWYSADKFKIPGGRSVPIDLDVQTIVPQLFWSSGHKINGGDFASALIPSFARTDFNDVEDWGFGDLGFAPLVLGWKEGNFEFTFGDIVSAPSGKFDSTDASNIGLGYWSNAVGVRSHYYSDESRTIAVMIQGIFETNGIRRDDHFRPGNNFILEWGVSRSVGKGFELGLAGYDMWQVSDDKNQNDPFGNGRERVHAAGVQIAYWVEFQKLLLSLRCLREYGAMYRPEGSLTTFNISYQF